MGHLRAAAQYDDWKGELAADGADNDIHSLFEAHKPADHTLVAWSFYSAEPGGPVLEGIFAPGASYEAAAEMVKIQDPLPVASVKIEVSGDDFLKLFKRLHLVGTKQGFDLSGRDLDGYEE